jgi:ketosteroid isomerase-like protein
MKKPSNEERREKRKILSIVNAVPKAISAKDTKLILSIYDTEDAKFCTFEDIPPYSRINGTQFRNFINNLANLESSSIKRRDLRIDLITSDVAVVTGIDDWKIKQKNVETMGKSRFTIIFQKKGPTWKVVHEHFTNLPKS